MSRTKKNTQRRTSTVGGMNNVKIFVLYLMQNIGYPLDFVTINDIVVQNDYVIYIDFAEAFGAMIDDGLVRNCGKDKDGFDLFEVTPKGRFVAEQLYSDVIPDILNRSLKWALRYIDFRKRGVKVETSSEKRGDGEYEVTLKMTERGRVIYCTTVTVDSDFRAQLLRSNFKENTENIYRVTMALLAGEANFLYND